MLFITLILVIIATSVVAFGPAGKISKTRTSTHMKIELPPLPYAYDALEPMLGKQTLEIHHDKHHAKYVNTANTMIEGTDMEGMSEIEVSEISYL